MEENIKEIVERTNYKASLKKMWPCNKEACKNYSFFYFKIGGAYYEIRAVDM